MSKGKSAVERKRKISFLEEGGGLQKVYYYYPPPPSFPSTVPKNLTATMEEIRGSCQKSDKSDVSRTPTLRYSRAISPTHSWKRMTNSRVKAARSHPVLLLLLLFYPLSAKAKLFPTKQNPFLSHYSTLLLEKGIIPRSPDFNWTGEKPPPSTLDNGRGGEMVSASKPRKSPPPSFLVLETLLPKWHFPRAEPLVKIS